MALAISHEDTQVLLRDKNVLQDSTLDKYRHAGQISQTALAFVCNLINQSYHHQTGARVPIHELCLLTDSFLSTCLESAFKNKVNERGIAHPTTIDVDELASGWCPELDDVDVLKNWNKNVSADEAGSTVNGYKRCIDGFLQPGDVVTITLGCHIDGYTSQVSHTMVIYPTAENEQNVKVPTGPLLAGKADAVAAAHIAMETVVALLGCALTPEKLASAILDHRGWWSKGHRYADPYRCGHHRCYIQLCCGARFKGPSYQTIPCRPKRRSRCGKGIQGCCLVRSKPGGIPVAEECCISSRL